MNLIGRPGLGGLLLSAVLLGGCTSSPEMAGPSYPVDPETRATYASVEGEPFKVPAVPIARIPPEYRRQTVATPANIPNQPGTIVVDPANKFLYLVEDGGQSMRYGIGVGRQGFSWAGTAEIHDKQHWPKWFPPVEMQARDAYAAKFPDGMDGGPKNPLGSRAMYLWQDNKDTLFRIHATIEPLSIGKAVSSGCIRMLNQDVMDLYERVPLGTKVVVLQSLEPVIDPYAVQQPGGPPPVALMPTQASLAPAAANRPL